MSRAAYHLTRPERRTSCVVFASPHSSSEYPENFLRRAMLDARQIRSSEDAFVDTLFEVAAEFGAPFLKAGAPRAYVDLNRGPDELDPALFEGVRRAMHNPRVASGLGVVPRVVANGKTIYRGKLPLEEAHHRIARFWRPYHDALSTLVDESLQRFGQAILVDCHSMPHEALETVGASSGPRPDVVLGDRFGASASASVVERIEAAFTRAGLRVARNMPFAGAYVCQRYGRPARHQHAVQVEIDRSLYMDEARIEKRPDFDDFRELMTQVTAELASMGRAPNLDLAAE